MRGSIKPPLLQKPPASDTIEDHLRVRCEIGIFNERAVVLVELDHLAREFEQAGKPNTARGIRESAAKIDARLHDGWR